jgi:hypothetical protein
MNPKVKQLWIDALRSGKYKKGRKRLESNGKFCCLGVLCFLASERGVIKRRELKDGSIQYGKNRDYLPSRVMRWAGLTDFDPGIDHDRVFTIAQLNDKTSYRLRDIAKVIEEQL